MILILGWLHAVVESPIAAPNCICVSSGQIVAEAELSDDRNNVIAEVPVYGSIGAMDRLTAGRADAVRYRNRDAEIVFDWKSDVDPNPDERATYAHQLAQYVHVLRAKRGAIVYMTTGEIQWVDSTQVSIT